MLEVVGDGRCGGVAVVVGFRRAIKQAKLLQPKITRALSGRQRSIFCGATLIVNRDGLAE